MTFKSTKPNTLIQIGFQTGALGLVTHVASWVGECSETLILSSETLVPTQNCVPDEHLKYLLVVCRPLKPIQASMIWPLLLHRSRADWLAICSADMACGQLARPLDANGTRSRSVALPRKCRNNKAVAVDSHLELNKTTESDIWCLLIRERKAVHKSATPTRNASRTKSEQKILQTTTTWMSVSGTPQLLAL